MVDGVGPGESKEVKYPYPIAFGKTRVQESADPSTSEPQGDGDKVVISQTQESQAKPKKYNYRLLSESINLSDIADLIAKALGNSGGKDLKLTPNENIEDGKLYIELNIKALMDSNPEEYQPLQGKFDEIKYKPSKDSLTELMKEVREKASLKKAEALKSIDTNIKDDIGLRESVSLNQAASWMEEIAKATPTRSIEPRFLSYVEDELRSITVNNPQLGKPLEMAFEAKDPPTQVARLNELTDICRELADARQNSALKALSRKVNNDDKPQLIKVANLIKRFPIPKKDEKTSIQQREEVVEQEVKKLDQSLSGPILEALRRAIHFYTYENDVSSFSDIAEFINNLAKATR